MKIPAKRLEGNASALPTTSDPLLALVSTLTADQRLALMAALAAGAVPTNPSPTSPPPTEPIYLSVPAYAKRLGIGEATVRNMVRLGLPATHLPSSDGGRTRVRIKVAEADAWVDAGGAAQGVARSATAAARQR